MRLPRLLIAVAARKITVAAAIGCILLVTLLFSFHEQIANTWHIAFQNDQPITQLYFTDPKTLPVRLSAHESTSSRVTILSNHDLTTSYIASMQNSGASTILDSHPLTLHTNQPVTIPVSFTMPDNGPALITISLPQLQQTIHFNIKEAK